MKHGLGSFLTVGEVAERLGTTRVTVNRWCQSGKIPATPRPYGSKITYLISPQVVGLLLKEQEEACKVKHERPAKPHDALLQPWKKAMEKGLLTGKPFSPLTVDYYLANAKAYLKRHSCLSVQAFKSELMRIPPHQFGKRFKYHKAIVSFAKFLIQEGQLDSSFLEEVKPLFPKRNTPPKRLTVEEDALGRLLDACKTPYERLIVILLSNTGLRVSEACALRLEDIDLEKGVLSVQKGKGGKARKVGLSQAVVRAIEEHLSEHPCPNGSSLLFFGETNNQQSRYALGRKLENVGRRAGVKVSPHALRRAFVTLNANKGRPLQMLQMACGHSDIKTTMSYCRTTEQEVIEAMRMW